MHARLPAFHPHTFEDMSLWFRCLYFSGLLYHPDDPADAIVHIDSEVRLFSDPEARTLNQTITQMFERFGDAVYEAAYPCFHHHLHGTWPPTCET